MVIVFAYEEKDEARTREVFAEMGAESIDSVRENWWRGLREAEAETYRVEGRDFTADEADYRRGFEAALHSKLRGRSYDEAAPELIVFYHEARSNAAFRRGYERGFAYYKALREEHRT